MSSPPPEAPSPEDIGSRYARIRGDTLTLAAPLCAQDAQVQSMAQASPTKWHLAHVTWFFETFVLERFEHPFAPFDPRYRVLFNSYYQGVGAMHPRHQRGLITHPTWEDVLRYRSAVDARMQALLHACPDRDGLAGLVTLGLHHEQQHQELVLTDIQHVLSFSPGHPPYAAPGPRAAHGAGPLRWFGYAGGLIECGHDPARDGTFCFDNETPRHRTYCAPFEIASRPASCAEYLAFIEDGGYQRAELWLSLGWEWLCDGARRAPLYWQNQDGAWTHHTLYGTVTLDPHAPVCHLSYFEADAYARWAGARLPTEFEWEHAARSLRAGTGAHLGGQGIFHPLAAPDDDDQPAQMFGDVWEWTQSSYAAYPGYRPLPGAVGEYNGKFMCNQYVLRGGSCATPAGHIRASYRNFFAPDAQWQFCGVRLARDAAPALTAPT